MTENEKESICGLNFLKEKLYNGIYADRLDCIDSAITALKEIQQYRKIGTVKEWREAVEKQKPRVGIVTAGKSYPVMCPSCGHKMELPYHHCIFCGQNLIYYGKAEK